MTDSKRDKVVQIYRKLPMMQCKGLCWETCGPVPLTRVEAGIIKERHGVFVKHDNATQTCSLLTEDKKCSIYEDRPLICRMWGTVDDPMMRCKWGCIPLGGRMTNKDGHKLIREMSLLDMDEHGH